MLIGSFRFINEFLRYFCADLKCSSAFFGHQGCASSHPCLFCHASLGKLGPSIEGERTWQSMSDMKFSMVHKPLLLIPPSRIIPPSFHLLHGVAGRLIELVKDRAKVAGSGEQIDRILELGHAKMDPRKKNYTGFLLIFYKLS
jgi:hypothetical protein